MLKKKQSIASNDEWLQAFETCTDSVSEERTDFLENQAVARISSVNGMKACSGWIAGKDSLVIQKLIELSGIECTPIMWRGVNEYPAMSEWVEENKPENLFISTVEKFTLKYLEDHPGFLFCQGGNPYRQKWMAAKWAKQRRDTEPYGVFITGRRLLDGNQCGSAENGYLRGKTLSPIADWSHEELLAYIKRRQIKLPPFYSWSRGFLLGSVAMGEWTERPKMGLTVDEVWQELWDIDSSIVTGAADVLTSAREFLEGRK